MTLHLSIRLIAMAVAASHAFGQDLRPPAIDRQVATVQQSDTDTLVADYLNGDVENALRAFEDTARHVLLVGKPLAGQAALALMHTELAMNAGTFGRYSRSAPLETAKPGPGLTGMFEPDSLIADRLMADVLTRARTVRGSAPALVSIVRDWFVDVVSYCLRWKLDCANALLAEAAQEFPGDAAILLLSGSVAEARGRPREAVLHLRRALAADASLAEAHLRLGRLLLQSGNRSEARTALDRALARSSDVPDPFVRHFALLLLADLDQRTGQLTRARLRRADAAKVPPMAAPLLAREHLTPWQLYATAQYRLHDARMVTMRRVLRAWPAGY